jgi:acetyltransferase-like isoleucine patch superfamily enzyme
VSVVKKINSLFWNIYLRLHGVKVGRNFSVLGPIDVLLRDGARWRNIVIGNDVTLSGKTYLRLRKNGRIVMEDGVRVGTEVWLVGANECELRVGENSILSSYSIFNGGHGITIGPNCIFAAFVYINTSDHNFKREKLIQEQEFFGGPVEIGGDVWLGGHVFINKGVRIGNGAVIGAGAIVTKDVPDYKVAVGNPAHVLKDRE